MKTIKRLFSNRTGSYSIQTVGEGFALRKYLLSNGKRISPWHNVLMKND